MSAREFVTLVKECKIPVAVAEINNTFQRAAGGKADRQIVLAGFIEALVRLTVKNMATSTVGQNAIKAGKVGEGLRRLLTNHVLAHAASDSMGARPPLACRAAPRRAHLASVAQRRCARRSRRTTLWPRKAAGAGPARRALLLRVLSSCWLVPLRVINYYIIQAAYRYP